jgi:hypothetical protein
MSRLARTSPAGTRWVSDTRPFTPGHDASAPAGNTAATATEAMAAETRFFMTATLGPASPSHIG